MSKKVIAVDLDSTIFKHIDLEGYQTKLDMRTIGEPIEKNTNFLKDIKKEFDSKLIIYSSRWWGDYNQVRKWLNYIKFPYSDIVLGRLKADMYFCDRAVNAVNYTKKEVIKLLTDKY